MLSRLSVATYVDTFDGTSSDEDMQRFLSRSYDESVLRAELANPDSEFYVVETAVGDCLPDGGETGSVDAADAAVGVEGLDGTADQAQHDRIDMAYIKLNFSDAQLEDMGPDAMEIQRLYVRTQYKGMGLGTRLMALAFDRARDRGLNRVWLGVWEHNEPAKRFYKDKGFVRIGQHDFWQGDDKQTDFLLAREV
jgi:diamine N-acetyltransferase